MTELVGAEFVHVIGFSEMNVLHTKGSQAFFEQLDNIAQEIIQYSKCSLLVDLDTLVGFSIENSVTSTKSSGSFNVSVTPGFSLPTTSEQFSSTARHLHAEVFVYILKMIDKCISSRLASSYNNDKATQLFGIISSRPELLLRYLEKDQAENPEEQCMIQ